MTQPQMFRVLRWSAVAVLTAVATGVVAQPAWAGEWIEVSCVNPSGSAAPSLGWVTFTLGGANLTPIDNNDDICGPGSPMTAELGDQAPAANDQSEALKFIAPAGSTLQGGSLDVNFSAYGGGPHARAVAAVLEPNNAFDESDTVFKCEEGLGCGGPGDSYSGEVPLPTGRGGAVYVIATCQAASGYTCNTNPSGAGNGYWAQAEVSSAQLLMGTSAVPGGSGFSGSILQGTARGMSHLVFTASDPGGPGVYAVRVAVDGRSVWSGTPNTNDGACVPVGSSGGILMFDDRQPCLQSEVVDVPVPTRRLSNGAHELTVTVIDAAGNQSTVLDRTITVPQATPIPSSSSAIHARFLVNWDWRRAVTKLRSITVSRLPRDATIAARCAGRGCPRLRVAEEHTSQVQRLLSALAGRKFHAGDTLYLSVTSPGHKPEIIRLDIRNGLEPLARLIARLPGSPPAARRSPTSRRDDRADVPAGLATRCG